VRKPADADALAKALFERTIQREARDLARLHQVIELAEHDGCQASHLGAHFGEPLDDPCSHCSWCANRHTPLALPERRCAEIDDGVWSTAVALAQRNPQVLSDPRVLARLLCGLTSPQLTKAKLTRNELFGVLQHVPFQQVLQRAEQSL
jgi:ATP-dependent DNA helicase RecQ